jgi:TDG/mug DNA glycosylase family protein
MTPSLPDIMAGHLSVVFCGINPGLSAAASGHHFAGRGNRFWRVIHRAGFTPREIDPRDDGTILQHQCGLTTLVGRPTARADQVSATEFLAAAALFKHKMARYAPRYVAFLGKAAYCAISGQRGITWGPQSRTLANAAVWVLPNPSGRNRTFSIDQLVDAYRWFYKVLGSTSPVLLPGNCFSREEQASAGEGSNAA